MSAEFVLEMAWKSSALAVAVLILLMAMRRQDPSHRAAVGGLGLTLLLMLPVIVLAVTVLPVPSIDLPAPTSAGPIVPATMDQGAAIFPLAGPEPQLPSAPIVPFGVLIGAFWAAGALFVLLRLAVGLLTLRRWTQAAERVSSPGWTNFIRNCGAPEATLLLISDRVPAPLSWGWHVPAILINRETLAQPREAEAIIAHEAAHLARLDWLRLLAARFAVALFWFNPLVWLLERRHLQDVEEAADAEAASRVEPTVYAQTLLNVARDRSAPLGANSMACGALSKRVKQVLNGRVTSPWERTWRIGALAGVATIAGPLAVTQFVTPAVSAAVAATPPIAQFARPVLGVSTAADPIVATPPSPAVVQEPKSFEAMPLMAATLASAAAVQAPSATLRFDTVEDALDAQARRDAEQVAKQARMDGEQARRDAAQVRRDAEQIAKQARMDAEQARRDAALVARDAKLTAARARVEAAAAMRHMRNDLLRGADDMERGAIEMRSGATQMRDEARKLRDPAYRAEQRRKAAARGDHVPTDQELIDAIPKMEEGARKMDAGVEKMRRGAQRMREQARRS